MPVHIVDFALHGQGDIAIEADDPGDAERKFSAIPVEDLHMARRMEVRGVSPLPEHLVPVFRRIAGGHLGQDYVELARPKHRKVDEASTAPSEHYCQFIPSPGSKDGFCLAFVDRDTPGYYEDDDDRQVFTPVQFFNPGCGKPASLEWKSGDRTGLSRWLCEEHYDLVSKARGSASSAGGTEGS